MNKILYLCPRFPYPPDRGDRIRSYNNIKNLAHFNQVRVLCFRDDNYSVEKMEKLKNELNVEVKTCSLNFCSLILSRIIALLQGLPIHVAYFQSFEMEEEIENSINEGYNCLYANLMRMAPYLEKFYYLVKDKVFLDLTDSLAINYLQRCSKAKGLKKIYLSFDSYATKKYEDKLLKQFKNIVVCSEVDKNYMKNSVPLANISVIPNAVNTDYFYNNDLFIKKGNVCVLTGTMDYFPNIEAALGFVHKVMPFVMEKIPDLTFYIVGHRPSEKVLALRSNNVIVTGSVPDVRPFLKKAKAFVCFMNDGTGTQNKVLEAMACGLPVVTTSNIASALGFDESDGLLIADDYRLFADKLIKLMQDDYYRIEKGETSIEAIKNKYSVSGIASVLRKYIESRYTI